MSLGSNSVLDTLTHPDLLTSISRAYPAVVEIQTGTATRNADGQPVTTWETAVTARGIFSVAPPLSERRRTDLTVQTATHVLDLQGYYPAVAVTQRAVVNTAVSDGISKTLNIVAVHHDSQNRQTKLELEEVNH